VSGIEVGTTSVVLQILLGGCVLSVAAAALAGVAMAGWLFYDAVAILCSGGTRGTFDPSPSRRCLAELAALQAEQPVTLPVGHHAAR
jgi:hypothetical protein